MDVILPYVAWITLLAFVTDLLLPGCRGGPSPGPRPREPGAGPALWKSYGDRSILERINLDVASGSFVTLVGASGCGKSTFLRILLGQERASRGTILVDGAALPDEPGPERGIVFQRYSVFPHLTVLGNAILGLELTRNRWWGRLGGAARRQAIEQGAAMLDAVGLGHVKDAMPASLSGGMQQRLRIAQALILHPSCSSWTSRSAPSIPASGPTCMCW